MTSCRTSYSRAAPLIALALAGCTGLAQEPGSGRTPQEMLLLSQAAERAITRYDAPLWSGRRVAVDVSLLRSIDRGYVRSAFRAHLARHGCILQDDLLAPEGTRSTPAGQAAAAASGAEVVLEVRCAALGVNDLAYHFGIPEGTPIPFPPGASPPAYVITSGVGIGYDRMDGWAVLQVWARDARTGAFLSESPALWGSSYEGLFDDIWPSREDQARARRVVERGGAEASLKKVRDGR